VGAGVAAAPAASSLPPPPQAAIASARPVVDASLRGNDRSSFKNVSFAWGKPDAGHADAWQAAARCLPGTRQPTGAMLGESGKCFHYGNPFQYRDRFLTTVAAVVLDGSRRRRPAVAPGHRQWALRCAIRTGRPMQLILDFINNLIQLFRFLH
jgi:hypothetical protein